MAVTLETSIKRFRGLSTDLKPGHDRDGRARTDPPHTIPINSVFTERDTGHRYVWTGSWPWVRQEQTIEAFFETLVDVNLQMLQMLSAIKRGHETYLWGEEVEPE